MNKYVPAGLVVALLLAVGGYFYPTLAPSLGSTTVQVTDANCLFMNGFHFCPTKKPFISATTTICAIKSPAATSTLVFASAAFSVSSTSASTVTIAKAATAFATTTLIVAGPFAANAKGTLISSSTPSSSASVDGTNVIAPNNYVVVGMAGGTGTFSPTGSCSAEFDY